jgi:hypothetical protein
MGIMLHIETRTRIGKGRNPKCPVCDRGIDSNEKRLETWLFAARSRQFHFECAKHLARKILSTIELEEGGEVDSRQSDNQR